MQLLAESCEFFVSHMSHVVTSVEMVYHDFALDNVQILICKKLKGRQLMNLLLAFKT
jgi:hypothetical protein